MQEERRLVTVLFADIVGSTSMVGDHDPELVRGTLQSTFAALRVIIEADGGTVEKFIGDEVMAVFGAPVAHEDDAERALRAAFTIRAEVAARSARGQLPLELRIGLNSGEVVSGGHGNEFTVTGQAVNGAARVRQAAKPGEILVGSLTHALTASTVTYAEVRQIDARGIGTIAAWPAIGLVSAVPVKPLTRGGAFVAREEELQLLLAVERRMHDDPRAHLVTIFGPTGIGKSRLAAEFADAIGTTRVRYGHCLPYGEAVAFWPLREIVYAEAGIAAADTRAEALEKLDRTVAEGATTAADADAVARRLAVLTGLSSREEALPDEPPPNIAQELRWGLRRFLEWRARSGPLVLVFEDLHWGDPTLLDTLDYLAEWATAPLLLLCLARPELQDVRPHWGIGRSNAITVTLRSLTPAEARRIVGALDVHDAFDAAVRTEIVERAEGNPLFLEELVRMLHELPELVSATEPLDVVRQALPPTLQGLIAARIDRLPPAVTDVVKRAAVLGRVFSEAGFAAFGADGGPVDPQVAEAVRADVLVTTDEPAFGSGTAYRFRHSLIRDVVYRSIPKSVRWRMHDALGRWIETTSGDRAAEHEELIAFHAEQASWTAIEIAEPSAPSLGERAFPLLLAGATRWRRAGVLRTALGLYERAARLGEVIAAPPAKLVEARGFAALARFYVEGARGALVRLDEALAAARAAGPSEVLVRLASQRGFVARLESLDASGALFAEGITAAKATGDPELIAHAMLMSNAQSWMIGDLDEQRRLLSEADSLMTASGRTAERGVALAWLATNASQSGAFPSAVTYLEQSEQLARASGSRFQQWAAARAAARDALVMGHIDQALSLAKASLAFAKDIGARRPIALSHIRMGEVLYAAGDLAGSRAMLEEGHAVLDPQTMQETLVEASWKLSRTCLALGDTAAARTYAEAAVAAAPKTDRYSAVTVRIALAAVCASEGDIVEAERLLREALTSAELTGYRALTTDACLALAVLLASQQRHREARPYLERARAFFSGDLTSSRRSEIDTLLAREIDPAPA